MSNSNTHGLIERAFCMIPVISFLAVLLFPVPVKAICLKTNWAQRVDLSEKIIRGKVVETRSYWNVEKDLIYTDVIVYVDEYLKGSGPRERILKIRGGTVGDRSQWVSDTPQFEKGGDYVILLESSGQVTGGPDGVYRLKGEDSNPFLTWLRKTIAGDPDVSREGPPLTPELQPN
jgi:hypothetical protein